MAPRRRSPRIHLHRRGLGPLDAGYKRGKTNCPSTKNAKIVDEPRRIHRSATKNAENVDEPRRIDRPATKNAENVAGRRWQTTFNG